MDAIWAWLACWSRTRRGAATLVLIAAVVLGNNGDSDHSASNALIGECTACSSAVYRAFHLEGLLEIDRGFVPRRSSAPWAGARSGSSSGTPGPPSKPDDIDAGHLIGLAWHHVLHARSCVERGFSWQAEYWISAVRDHVLTLACRRLGHVTAYAKGADKLPTETHGSGRGGLVRSLAVGESTAPAPSHSR